MMKRTLAMILCCALLLVFAAACGGNSAPAAPAPAADNPAPAAPAPAADNPAPAADNPAPAADNPAPAADNPAPAADGEVYELVFQNHDPASSAITKYLEGWVEEVEAASNGRLKITLYSGGSLGAGTESYDMVVNNTADMAWFTTAMYAGRFPITEGFALPMLPVASTRQGALALNDVFEAGLLDPDFPDTKVMSVYTNTLSVIGCVKPGGTGLEDFKGMKLRAASGYITDFVTAIGSVPISIPSPDTYDAVSKGVVEGYVSDWNAVVAINLAEVTDHIVDYSLLISPCITVMNKDSFENLPPDLQDLLVEYTGLHMSEGMIEAWGSMIDTGVQLCEEKGVELLELPDDVIAEWSELAKPVQQKWIDSVTEKGYDGQAIFDAYVEAIAKFAE